MISGTIDFGTIGCSLFSMFLKVVRPQKMTLPQQPCNPDPGYTLPNKGIKEALSWERYPVLNSFFVVMVASPIPLIKTPCRPGPLRPSQLVTTDYLVFGSVATTVHREFYSFSFTTFISDLGSSLGHFVAFSFYTLWDSLITLGTSPGKIVPDKPAAFPLFAPHCII